MLLEFSILNQLPVGSFEEGGLIGKVAKTIFSKSEGRVLGFLVKLPGVFSGQKIASFEDVISIDQAGVVVRSSESLVDKNEIVRVNEILKSNFSLLGLKAVAKDKKNLGRVSDALIDTDSGELMRLYVKHFFSSLVFERSQIQEITLKNVVLKAEREEKAKKPIENLAQAEVA